LARKLDAIEESPGVTVLDNSLVQWTQESGPLTHDAQDLAVVTFGSAAGFFKTGMNVDYRSLNPNAHLHIFGQYFEQFLGLSLRQWQATVLQAMGVPRTEFESNGRPGYGDPYYDPSYPNGVHPNVIAKASDIVPLIKA
ncbi:MAG TPA: hypothetical protein VEY30_03505, partial [Myxococcaceae bacterium]|nr:hypothetical protein [Myxococcaceae bacterium]